MPQQFCQLTSDVVHFNHNSLLAFSVLIIDQFMTAPARKLNASAERLLANLDLLKVYPRYPFPQATATSFLTSTNYLHQLCLAATTPTLLLWLTRSISLALKKLCLEELSQNTHYYNFVYRKKIDINQLKSDNPNQLNPYVASTLQRALGFEFTQRETQKNKELPRVFHPSKPKKSSVGLVVHWEKDECMCGAIIEHTRLFKPLMSDEHSHFLFHELQNYQPTLPIAETIDNNFYLDRYISAKEAFSQLQLSLTELKTLYLDTLDTMFEAKHQHHIRIFVEHLHHPNKNYSDSSDRNQNHTQPLNSRIYHGLEELLCRLIALKVIPDNILNNDTRLTEQHIPSLTF